jgi:hypothetical protein
MDKQRIIYVTGMKPKPEPGAHRPVLMRVLANALARSGEGAAEWLYAREENFVLVSWTSLLYAERADIAVDLPGVERLLEQPMPTDRDRREAAGLRRRLLRIWHLVGDSYPWLSRIVASSALKVTLADVRRYLSNSDGVADAVRRSLIDQLLEAWNAGERVLVIGHSLGSVVAYDSFWQLSREARRPERVDLFLTLGSPLATRFIRKRLKGAELRGVERYPDNIRRWVNVSARGELVSLHQRVRPFFTAMERAGLVEAIEDVTGIYNHFRVGEQLNVHKSYAYLNHPAVAGRIASWLGYSSSGSMRTSIRRLRSRP